MSKIINNNDSQARDWCFTVNNPKLSEIEMYNYIKAMHNVKYCTFVREKGGGTQNNPNGTEHHQGYIEFTIPMRFSKVKDLFSETTIGVNAHIEPREYSRKTCINYIRKTGNHLNKKCTQISDIYEVGEFSIQGKRNDIYDMYLMKKEGFTDLEITVNYPQYARHSKYITDLVYQEKTRRYKTQYRDMSVFYIYGPTRTGKTRYVYNKYGYENVYTAEGYDPNKMFDGYNGEDVLLLDEFRSGLFLGTLLRYIDGHPIKATCRYQNKQLCYTKVYIVSNWALEEQYPEIQSTDRETWKAFIARLNGVFEFKNYGIDLFEAGKDPCRDEKNLIWEIRKKNGLPKDFILGS